MHKKSKFALAVIIFLTAVITLFITGCGGGSGNGTIDPDPSPSCTASPTTLRVKQVYKIEYSSSSNRQTQYGAMNAEINAPTGVVIEATDEEGTITEVSVTGYGNPADGSTWSYLVKDEEGVFQETNRVNFKSDLGNTYQITDEKKIGNIYYLSAHGEDLQATYILMFNPTTTQLIGQYKIPGITQGHFIFVNQESGVFYVGSHLSRNIGYFDLATIVGNSSIEDINIPESNIFSTPYAETENPVEPFSGRLFDGKIWLTDFYANRVVESSADEPANFTDLEESEFSESLKTDFGIDNYQPNGIDFSGNTTMSVGWESTTDGGRSSVVNFATIGEIYSSP